MPSDGSEDCYMVELFTALLSLFLFSLVQINAERRSENLMLQKYSNRGMKCWSSLFTGILSCYEWFFRISFPLTLCGLFLWTQSMPQDSCDSSSLTTLSYLVFSVYIKRMQIYKQPLIWFWVESPKIKMCFSGDSPGGPAVKSLPSKAEHPGFDPWSGS